MVKIIIKILNATQKKLVGANGFTSKAGRPFSLVKLFKHQVKIANNSNYCIICSKSEGKERKGKERNPTLAPIGFRGGMLSGCRGEILGLGAEVAFGAVGMTCSKSKSIF